MEQQVMQSLLWLVITLFGIGTLFLLERLRNTTPYLEQELDDIYADLMCRRAGGKENFPLPIIFEVIKWPRVFMRWAVLVGINFAAGYFLWFLWPIKTDEIVWLSSGFLALLLLEYLFIRFYIPFLFHHKYEKDLIEVQALHEPQIRLLTGRIIDDSRDPYYKGDHLESGGRIITVCTKISATEEIRHSLFLPFGHVHPYGRDLTTTGPVSVFYEVSSSIEGCIGLLRHVRSELYESVQMEEGFGLTRPLSN